MTDLIFLLAVLVTLAWAGLAALTLWIDHRKRASKAERSAGLAADPDQS